MTSLHRYLPIAVASAFLLSACGDAPRATNPAVQACERLAKDQHMDAIGEEEVLPLEGGRYSIQLDVKSDIGLSHTACDFDPKTGAHITPPAKDKGSSK